MRLIDADTLLVEYDREHEGPPGRVRTLIEKAPTIEERKRGKWTIKNGELAFWQVRDVCSECGRMVIHKAPFYNFCPNCGADMRGIKDGCSNIKSKDKI